MPLFRFVFGYDVTEGKIMTIAQQTADVLRTLIAEIVTYPSALVITAIESRHTVDILIRTHKQDFGKVCGKRGAQLRAIETLANQILDREKKRVAIRMDEPSMMTDCQESNGILTLSVTRHLLSCAVSLISPPIVSAGATSAMGKMMIYISCTATGTVVDATDLGLAIKRIFGAIGRNHGTTIFVDWTVDKPQLHTMPANVTMRGASKGVADHHTPAERPSDAS